MSDQESGSGGYVAATGAALPGNPQNAAVRDPATTRPLGNLVMPDLLKLSRRLSATRKWDLGAALGALGVGAVGAALGALAADEPLKDAALVCLIAGVVAIGFGLLISHDRSETIAGIRRDLDFDIDTWCRGNPDLHKLREQYEHITQSPALWERLPGIKRKGSGAA